MFLLRCLILIFLSLTSALAAAAPTVRDAWVRALPPTQPVTAAYATVTNTGAEAIQLAGASIEGAGRVEIHTTREVDGLVRMQQLSTLPIAPGETVSLEPGGSHFMLFDLEAMPRPGESRRMCLIFEGAEELCIDAIVRKSAATDHSHHQHH